MPLLAANTTIDLMADAFRAALEGLTPRTTRSQTDGWKYFAPEHAPLAGTRWFRFEWDNDGLTESGFFYKLAAEIDLTLSIVTDYGGVPQHELDAIANDDHYQVADILDLLRLTTAPGMRRVQSQDWAIANTDRGDQVQVVHQYTVRYMQAKA